MSDCNVHHDILGHALPLGTTVCFSDGVNLKIGVIGKITPRMVRVNALGNKNSFYESGYLKHPKQTVVVSSADVTMHILKNAA